MSAPAEEITQAADGGAEPSADPGGPAEITREELLDAIVATLREDPTGDARDKLLAEIYLEASSHRQMLEEIAGTLQELLADPKRIVRAFFGRGGKRRRDRMIDKAFDAGEAIAEEELELEELEEEAERELGSEEG